MQNEEQYISFEEAEEALGVARATLHYYMRVLSIERKKFPLDKRAYMRVSDFERIKGLKEASQRRGPRGSGEEIEDDMHSPGRQAPASTLLPARPMLAISL
jgi:hypothetical protein